MEKGMQEKIKEHLDGLHFGLSHIKHNRMFLGNDVIEFSKTINFKKYKPIIKKMKGLANAINDAGYYLSKLEDLLDVNGNADEKQ